MPCGNCLGMDSDHPPGAHITTATVKGRNPNAGPGVWRFNEPSPPEVEPLMSQTVKEHDICGKERVPGNRDAPSILPIGCARQVHANVPIHVLDKARTIEAPRGRAPVNVRKSDKVTSQGYERLDMRLSY